MRVAVAILTPLVLLAACVPGSGANGAAVVGGARMREGGAARAGAPAPAEAHAQAHEQAHQRAHEQARAPGRTAPYLVVLGAGQDGGYPQAGTPPGPAWAPELRRYATSLALVDPRTGARWLFEATPDFRHQLHDLDRIAPPAARGDGPADPRAVDDEGLPGSPGRGGSPGRAAPPGLTGIFVTHAHVGHYAGLIHLGHEVIGARAVPVYAMPRMRTFLSSNGPWDQLVRFENIVLRPLEDGAPVRLADDLSVTPFRVPHRDEYSETVGFRIAGPTRTVVFLPDIDKWERWEAQGTRIEDVVARADVAYLDGTFFRDGEVPGRAMADIPHPFIAETMRRFADAPAAVRARIRFIHLNRTNPAAFEDSAERRAVQAAGFGVARRGEVLAL